MERTFFFQLSLEASVIACSAAAIGPSLQFSILLFANQVLHTTIRVDPLTVADAIRIDTLLALARSFTSGFYVI
jgi:hypothetical protein